MSGVDSRLQMSKAECFIDQSDPEPEPLSDYVEAVLEKSYALNNGLQYTQWCNRDRTSELILRPKRIAGAIRGEAFSTYSRLSSNMRHTLRAETERMMRTSINVEPEADMRTLVEYVPLLFMPNGRMVFGERDDNQGEIKIASDKLRSASERHALLGGVATLLYYIDYPSELRKFYLPASVSSAVQ